ncbi:MAG: hypothetical protein B7733_18120 [Myxococcales bacterium FL481]|nr:MAG: hypothetical protein B7733_18120 [Myxococcales bacterium FL481]
MRTDPANAYSVALAGIQTGMQRMVEASAKLTHDVAIEPLVEMKLAKAQVGASIQVAKAVDRSLGQLIDDLA